MPVPASGNWLGFVPLTTAYSPWVTSQRPIQKGGLTVTSYRASSVSPEFPSP